MRTAGGKAVCIINEPISETHSELKSGRKLSNIKSSYLFTIFQII